jgi:hypothetical protein
MKNEINMSEIGFSKFGILLCQKYPAIKDHKSVRILESFSYLDGNFRKWNDLYLFYLE